MCRRGENIYLRKDGRYEGRYVIGRKPNGATRFGYVYGYKYQEVRRLLLLRKAAQESSISPKYSLAFDVWAEQWFLEYVSGCVKPSTLQTYKRIVKHHLIPYWNKIPVHKITASDVILFISTVRNRNLMESTAVGIIRLFFRIMRDARESGIIVINPCRRLKISHPLVAEQRVLSKKEENAIMACVSKQHIPCQLALCTGMRLGEICALRWEDFDWNEKTLTVHRTVQRIYTEPGTALAVGSPKSSKSCRIIPLPEPLMRKLKEHKKDLGYVFGKSDKPAEPRTIQRQFKRLCDSLQINNVHFHTLRHSFATRAVNLGIDIKTISELLGHQSSKTTLDIYTHSSISRKKQAIEKLTLELEPS